MRLIDTHCHLDMDEFGPEAGSVVGKAVQAGVERVIVPGTSLVSSLKARELSREHDNVYFAAGIHPHHADEYAEEDLKALRRISSESDRLVAIGETGLDYHKGFSSPGAQRSLFRRMCGLARELDLPLIIHCREAFDDVFSILDEVFGGVLEGQMHCFGGDEPDAREALKRGLYISFATNITYKGAESLRRTLKSVPPERLMLETDGPYLSPSGKRGTRNEPVNVKELLPLYASTYSLSEEDIARITTHNANTLFGLGLEEPAVMAYAIRSSLYLNVTRRCTNRCTFCTRGRSAFVKGHRLDLSHEGTAREIIQSMGDLSGYDEIVFCGFGEPTIRLGTVKTVAAHIKEERPSVRVRLVTNGHGELIRGSDMAGGLAHLVDKVSVSVNAPDSETYDRLMRPVFRGDVLGAVLRFVENAQKAGIEVEFTALDIIPDEKMDALRSVAEKYGCRLRVRKCNEVG